MSRRLPVPSAPYLWASVVGVVLGLDAVLVLQERESLSEWYGRNWWKLAVVSTYLLCHLHGRPKRFAQFDPLHLGANAIRAHLIPGAIAEVASTSNTWPDPCGLHMKTSPTTAMQ